MSERMREQTCDAIFKNGVFQPLDDIEIAITEGQRVKLIIEPLDSSEDILELASNVYKGLSEEQIDEIEHLILKGYGKRLELITPMEVSNAEI